MAKKLQKTKANRKQRAKTGKTKRQQFRIPNILKVIAVTIIVVASGYGIHEGMVSFKQWFAGTRWGCVQRTLVKGTERFDSDKIIETASIPFGIGIYDSRLDSAQARVDALPGVRKCNLKAYPFGSVVIKVTEREPLATMFDSNVRLIDDEGVDFPRESIFERVDLPAINFINIERSDSVTELAVKYIDMLSDEYPLIYSNLSELVVNNDGFDLRLKQGGAEILSADVTDKSILGELSQFLSQKGENLPLAMEYVDMRFPQRIYIRPG